MQAELINRRLVKFMWAALIFFAWSVIQGAIQVQDPVRTLLEQGPGGMILPSGHYSMGCVLLVSRSFSRHG